MPQKFIIGKNVYLRGMEEQDAADPYLGWLNDREVTRFLSTVGHRPMGREELRQYIQSMNQSDKDVLFAIYQTKTDEFIGTSHLGPIDWLSGLAPLGIMIGDKAVWGKGHASEAIRLVTEYAFQKLNLHKVTAGVAVINEGSAKAFAKAGFEVEGRLKSQVFIDGQYYDSLYLGVTREDFLKKSGKE